MKDISIVDLYAFHQYAADRWGTTLSDISSFENIFKQDYSLILSGTGSLHYVESQAPILAQKYKIPLLSILDIWGNYELRYKNPPTYIISLDELSKNIISNLGFPKKNIFPLGNPHFDRLKEYINENNFSINPPYNISFFSQPIQEAKSALKDIVKFCSEYPQLIKTVQVTSHPRENTDWIKYFCNKHSNILHYSTEDSFSLLLSTDFNIGVSGTLQYESLMIGKPTLFYTNYNELENNILNLNFPSPIDLSFNATQQCVDLIRFIISRGY